MESIFFIENCKFLLFRFKFFANLTQKKLNIFLKSQTVNRDSRNTKNVGIGTQRYVMMEFCCDRLVWFRRVFTRVCIKCRFEDPITLTSFLIYILILKYTIDTTLVFSYLVFQSMQMVMLSLSVAISPCKVSAIF